MTLSAAAPFCSDRLVHQLEFQISCIGVPIELLDDNEIRQRVPDHRQFFPTQELEKIFSAKAIDQVLQHDCQYCSAHLSDNELAHPHQFEAKQILQHPDWVNLFALLVYIRYPLLIGQFLIIADVPQPPRLIASDTLQRAFSHLDHNTRRYVISKFEDRKYQFSAPSLDHDNYNEYSKEVIIPYLNEIPKGVGGFGRVDEVWMHPAYCNLDIPVEQSEQNGVLFRYKRLARKEMTSELVSDFLKEKKNLERVKVLCSDHIMHIQKTYQLGRRFNLLFRLAKMDLHQYLRTPLPSIQRKPKVESNVLWKQVYGIAKALQQIIHFKSDDDEESLLGSHLDLTPRNILIGYEGIANDNNLRIADLGQAQFIKGTDSETPFRGGQRTHFINGAGTDAYSPPEYHDRQCDEKYDVFSLGIIVLEILTFVVRGPDGLLHEQAGLDSVRNTESDGHWNQRVYSGASQSAVLKGEVEEFMTALLNDHDRDNASRAFVQKLLDLLKAMMEPDRRQRMGINDVVDTMRQIFSVEDVDLPVEVPRARTDETVLVDFVQSHYARSFRSSSVPLLIFETRAGTLRMFSDIAGEGCICSRQDLALQMVSGQDTRSGSDKYEYSIVHVAPNVTPTTLKNFTVYDAKSARILQSALTGHRISARFKVRSVKLERYLSRSFNNPFRRWAYLQPNDNVPWKGRWVEIWVEKAAPQRDEVAVGEQDQRARHSGRLKRRVDAGSHIPAGRVVINYEECFLIIPFARESRITRVRPDTETEDPYFARFEPMDRMQRRFFTAFNLMGAVGTATNIPMSHGRLHEMEKASQIECSRVDLELETESRPYSFYDVYRNEKSIWHQQIKAEDYIGQSWLPG